MVVCKYKIRVWASTSQSAQCLLGSPQFVKVNARTVGYFKPLKPGANYVHNLLYQLRRLVSSFLTRGPGFASMPVHVGFVAENGALGEVSIRVLRVSPVSIILPGLHTHTLYHLKDGQ